MKLYALLAGAAALALTAGAASAATHHHARHASSASAGSFAEPKQPVAYSKLDSYLKAGSHARTSKDWSLETGMAAGAQTGTAANAAATTGPTPDNTGASSWSGRWSPCGGRDWSGCAGWASRSANMATCWSRTGLPGSICCRRAGRM